MPWTKATPVPDVAADAVSDVAAKARPVRSLRTMRSQIVGAARIRPRTAREIISDPVGIAAGFVYEECQRVLMHDPRQFDERGYCRNNVLKYFIKENLFLPQSILDYNKIQGIYT